MSPRIDGVAVIAHGVPRLTLDIDATVAAAQLSPAKAASTLAQVGIRSRIAHAEPFAARHHVLLCVHEASATPVDLSVDWLPFEEEAWLVASRPRDVDDAEGLLTLHGAGMNLARVRQVVGEFSRRRRRPETTHVRASGSRSASCALKAARAALCPYLVTVVIQTLPWSGTSPPGTCR